jgi:hypothetical protein
MNIPQAKKGPAARMFYRKREARANLRRDTEVTKRLNKLFAEPEIEEAYAGSFKSAGERRCGY